MGRLVDRIRRGEEAIKRAKEMGQDVRAWERHLEQLKQAQAPDPTEGPIVAVEICSEVLQAQIWLALDESFDPKDNQAVFYTHEFPMLADKTAAELRETHKVKLA